MSTGRQNCRPQSPPAAAAGSCCSCCRQINRSILLLLTQSAIGSALSHSLSLPTRLWACKGIEQQYPNPNPNPNPNRVVSVTYIKGQFRFGAAALYNWNLRQKESLCAAAASQRGGGGRVGQRGAAGTLFPYLSFSRPFRAS